MPSRISTSCRAFREFHRLKRNADRMLALAGGGDLDILVAGDTTVRGLNRRFRGVDRTTDVLSFEGLPETGHLGDIVISLPRAKRQAHEHGHALITELTHLVSHGILHLKGHDHESPADKQRMQFAEARLLAAAGLSPLRWSD